MPSAILISWRNMKKMGNDPCRTRTYNPQIKRAAPYPAKRLSISAISCNSKRNSQAASQKSESDKGSLSKELKELTAKWDANFNWDNQQ